MKYFISMIIGWTGVLAWMGAEHGDVLHAFGAFLMVIGAGLIWRTTEPV